MAITEERIKESKQTDEYYVYAAANCTVHNEEHTVSGLTKDKKLIGGLKNDLVAMLREDYPSCKLQPKPVYVGYHHYEKKSGEKSGKWSDLIPA